MRTRLTVLLAFLFVAVPVWAQPAVAPAPPRYAATVAQARMMAQQYLNEKDLPGLAVAVSVAGETVWSEGFGYANLEHRVPVWPTTEDLLLFANAHLGDRFLSDKGRGLLFTEQKTSGGDGVNYGFGWRVAPDDQGRLILGHTGGSVGGTSIMIMQPDAQVVVVLLINLSSADLSLGNDLMGLFLDAVSTP